MNKRHLPQSVDCGVALFRLLYHVGLIAAADFDNTRQQATWLSIYLDRYRLAGLEASMLTLSQPDTSMSAYLKPGLAYRTHIALHCQPVCFAKQYISLHKLHQQNET